MSRIEDEAYVATEFSGVAGIPSPSPGFFDLSEYLIGRVAVATFLPESNGTVDPSTEDWTPDEESRVLSEIQVALNFWAAQEPRAHVAFVREDNIRISTSYEPISHHSYEDSLWINEILASLGYASGSRVDRLRAYLNDLRTRLQTDWAFAIVIVNSSNDPDGKFADGISSGAYYGGPYLFMTYDNGSYGIDNMDYVTAHEMGHIFYATDEYNGLTEWSGYLNAPDNEGSGCIMATALSWCVSTGTRLQLGWRDSDEDGILDILDVPPLTSITAYAPDPTSETQLTYSGTATVVPLANQNPQGPGNKITLSRLVLIEWRVDGGAWTPAQADDGSFDSITETFTFTTSVLPEGTHIIEAHSRNTEGNVDSAPASDSLTVVQNTPPVLGTVSNQTVDEETLLTFKAIATDEDGDPLTFSLANGSPLGASITTDGIFTWRPSETQGPYNYTVRINVSDGYKRDSRTVTIEVKEVNKPPVVEMIDHFIVDQERALTFVATASDSDYPAQTLRFSLGPDAPAGASISPSGQFLWMPGKDQGPGTFTLTIMVSDGLATVSKTITITVNKTGNNPFMQHYRYLVLLGLGVLVGTVILLLRYKREALVSQVSP